MKPPTPDDARRTFADGFARRVFAEVWCFWLVFRFHDRNNHVRKAVTLMAVGVWAVLEVASAVDAIGVTLPSEFWYLRLFVGLLLGRLWDIEFDNFAQIGIGDKGEK